MLTWTHLKDNERLDALAALHDALVAASEAKAAKDIELALRVLSHSKPLLNIFVSIGHVPSQDEPDTIAVSVGPFTEFYSLSWGETPTARPNDIGDGLS